MIQDFYIKPVLTLVKNPQYNTLVERGHQVIINMLVNKYLDNKLFNHIDPWDENLASIAWMVRASYDLNIMATPCQAVFGRDMIFKITSVVDGRVSTAAKQRQVDIDNVSKTPSNSCMNMQ